MAWMPIKFVYDADTSRILFSWGFRRVAGYCPSWIPSVVYPLYPKSESHIDANGLGGDMTTFIGLRAVTPELGHYRRALETGN